MKERASTELKQQTPVVRASSDHKRNANYSHEHQNQHRRYLDTLKQEFTYILSNPPVYAKTPKDFDKILAIAAGAFGTVYLVRDTSTLIYHAMKATVKENIIKKKALKQIFLEKKILQSINFPFVTSLHCTLKDNLHVYIVMPYELGGEIFSLIKKLGAFSEQMATFYAGQMVLALEYLHHCSVIHRDVKPENILICESGYIKLSDFGLCKILKSRTWTLCGTPEYLAPEIILSKGYTFSIDWWAFGVLVYEMICGYPPFYSTSPIKLYAKILDGQFKAPPVMTSACKSLVRGLLEIEPSRRTGALKAGVYDIKSHQWFEKMDWSALLHQRVFPPYIPKATNAGDVSNFPNSTDVMLMKGPECLYEKEFENF